MNTTDFEQRVMNGYCEPTSEASQPRVPRDFHESTGKATDRQASGARGQDASLDSVLKFAKGIQTKVKDNPYIVPIAIGGAAFTIGVLASSRILRKVVFFAGAYVLKYAIENAPKDEIMDFAKKVITDSFRASSAAA